MPTSPCPSECISRVPVRLHAFTRNFIRLRPRCLLCRAFLARAASSSAALKLRRATSCPVSASISPTRLFIFDSCRRNGRTMGDSRAFKGTSIAH